jgi:hypothetical protein
VPVRRSRGRSAGVSTADVAPAQAADDAGAEADTVEPATKVSAVERRRALALLLDAWRGVARDLVLAQLGAARTVRDVALLEELTTAARDLPDGSAAEALARLVRASELLDANVSPELLLDVLLVRWPRRLSIP